VTVERDEVTQDFWSIYERMMSTPLKLSEIDGI
jgi:hypothetical protein